MRMIKGTVGFIRKRERKKLVLIDRKSLWETIAANRILILFAIALLAGLGFGAAFAKTCDASLLKKLDFLFNSNFLNRAQMSFLAMFAASFASSFLFLFACFLCGLSLWGIAIIPFLLFFRGFGMGITSGYLYAAYGFQGFLFNTLVILPGAFLCVLALLLAAREGVRFSRRISSAERLPLRLYVTRYGAILAIAFASALLDSGANYCFSGWFSF